jgi:hypothetical protein
VPVFLLGLVVASLLLDILPARTGETPPDPAGTSAAGEDAMRELRHTALTVAFLSGIGITVRIGFAVFGAAVSLLALCAAVRGPQNLVSRAGVFGWAALAVAASMVPWMARGVVMSGYPVFPCSVGGMPVDWRLPAGTVHEIAAGMKSWSRVPGDWTGSLRPGWRWVWPWVSRLCRTFPFELRVPLSLAALSSALLVLGRRQRPSPTIWQWLLLLAPLASVAFWFCTAPEPRVAGSAFWVLGLTPLTLYLLSCNASVVRSVVLIFSVVLMAQNVNPIAFLHCWQRDPDPAKSVPLQTRTTNSGLTVHVPVEGDQCWSAPLPCAPRFDPNLRLRTRGDMSKGFTVGGAAGAGR